MSTGPTAGPDSAHCVVADGYGITLTVHRGNLRISDGIGRQRRTRSWPRIERDLRRILILGHTGTISLDAMRWCNERKIAVTQLDADNRIITLAAAPGLDDARLRRAQALASGNADGLAIARLLLETKIQKQADVANSRLSGPVLAGSIRRYADVVVEASTIEQCRDAESHAVNAYYGGWAGGVEIQFTEHDAPTVPDHWRIFASRRSPIMRGRTPRVATTPINGLLNYVYALAEVEARIALITLGSTPDWESCTSTPRPATPSPLTFSKSSDQTSTNTPSTSYNSDTSGPETSTRPDTVTAGSCPTSRTSSHQPASHGLRASPLTPSSSPIYSPPKMPNWAAQPRLLEATRETPKPKAETAHAARVPRRSPSRPLPPPAASAASSSRTVNASYAPRAGPEAFA